MKYRQLFSALAAAGLMGATSSVFAAGLLDNVVPQLPSTVTNVVNTVISPSTPSTPPTPPATPSAPTPPTTPALVTVQVGPPINQTITLPPSKLPSLPPLPKSTFLAVSDQVSGPGVSASGNQQVSVSVPAVSALSSGLPSLPALSSLPSGLPGLNMLMGTASNLTQVVNAVQVPSVAVPSLGSLPSLPHVSALTSGRSADNDDSSS